MRQAYIWRSVYGLTDRYHSGGGVLAVADDVDAARAAVRDHCAESKPEEELDADPDFTFPADSEPLVVIFPDAGCC